MNILYRAAVLLIFIVVMVCAATGNSIAFGLSMFLGAMGLVAADKYLRKG